MAHDSRTPSQPLSTQALGWHLLDRQRLEGSVEMARNPRGFVGLRVSTDPTLELWLTPDQWAGFVATIRGAEAQFQLGSAVQ
jgi:hypothetical protein